MEPKKKSCFKRIWGVLLAGLLFALFCAGCEDGEATGFRTISVVEVSGDVNVTRDGASYKAYVGMVLQEGYEITTGDDSYARFILDGDKYAKLEAGSKVVFENFGTIGSGKTRIRLESGSVTGEIVNPLGKDEEFVINTPNAVLAVRGTYFRIDIWVNEDGEFVTEIMTYGGTVASRRVFPDGTMSREEVLIKAGEKAVICMTEDDTFYVIEDETGEELLIDPEVNGTTEEGEEIDLTVPIEVEEIPDGDMIDLYHSIENGHDMFVPIEEIEMKLEERKLDAEAYTPVYSVVKELLKKYGDEEKKAGADITLNPTPTVRPTATAKARPTAEPTPTATAEPTATPEVTATEEPTEAPIPTEAAEATATPEPTATARPTATVKPTATARPTATAKPTATARPTAEPTPTAKPTATVKPTATARPTATAQPTATAAPTATPGPVYPSYPSYPSVPPTTHTHQEQTVRVEATCTEDGLITVTCKTCGEVISKTVIPATGHNFEEWWIVTAPTCTEGGSEQRNCLNEGCVYREGRGLEKVDHVYSEAFTTDIQPTCTEAGSKSRHCTNIECDVKVDVTEIPAGHVFGDWVITKPETCSEHGEQERSCGSCGETEKVYRGMLPHTEVAGGDVDCHLKCDVCGTVLEDGNSHSYDDGTETKAATCSEAGEMKYACSCGYYYTEEIPAAHVKAEETAAVTTCKYCGQTWVDIVDTNFPDMSFLAYVTSEFDTDGSGYLLGSELEITEIDVSGTSSQYGVISDLKGLSYFTELKILDCSYNSGLTSLDLSKNTKLTNLDCTRTSLTSLDVSKNKSLLSIKCYGTGLTSLDLSNNTNLRTLDCTYTKLTSLDLSKNTYLTTLICSNVSGLSSLDLSRNTTLTTLECSAVSGLTSLDLRNNTALTTLKCTDSAILSSLNLGGLQSLTKVECLSCSSLVTLNLEGCSSLQQLHLSSCGGLANLDISDCTALTVLDVSSCSFESLNISNVDVSNLTLYGLDGSVQMVKYNFYASNTNMTDMKWGNIKYSLFNSLKQVDLSGNQDITSLDLSGKSDLVKVDVSDCVSLKEVNVSNTGVSDLNVTGCNPDDAFVFRVTVTGSSITQASDITGWVGTSKWIFTN